MILRPLGLPRALLDLRDAHGTRKPSSLLEVGKLRELAAGVVDGDQPVLSSDGDAAVAEWLDIHNPIGPDANQICVATLQPDPTNHRIGFFARLACCISIVFIQ